MFNSNPDSLAMVRGVSIVVLSACSILVKIVKQPERTASGLYLHQSARENSRGGLKRAEVISVGPGRYNKHGERLPIEVSCRRDLQ